MATPTKTKNGSVVAEAVTDAAAKTTKEAKVVTETVLEATNQVNENMKAVLDAHQKMLHDSFNLWQRYSESYINFVASATKQTVEQSLALQEQLNKVAESNWQKAQDLVVTEQELFLNQSLALRERLIQVTQSNLKKAQGLAETEQKLALEATEALQDQAQASSERIAKAFTPNFK